MAMMRKNAFIPDRQAWLVDFWTDVQLASNKSGKTFNFGTLIADSWHQVGIERHGVTVNLVVAPTESRIQVELCIRPGQNALAIFDSLHSKKQQIERAIGAPLVWDRRTQQKSSFIRLLKTIDARGTDRQVAIDWYVSTLAKFVMVFQQHLLK